MRAKWRDFKGCITETAPRRLPTRSTTYCTNTISYTTGNQRQTKLPQAQESLLSAIQPQLGDSALQHVLYFQSIWCRPSNMLASSLANSSQKAGACTLFPPGQLCSTSPNILNLGLLLTKHTEHTPPARVRVEVLPPTATAPAASPG